MFSYFAKIISDFKMSLGESKTKEGFLWMVPRVLYVTLDSNALPLQYYENILEQL